MKQLKLSFFSSSLFLSLGMFGCGGSSTNLAQPLLVQPESDVQSSQTIQMIGSDRRMAVVYECWYALRQSFLTTPNDSGPSGGAQVSGNVVSNWNYLGNDPNAYGQVKSIVGSSNASVASNFSTSDSYGVKQAGDGQRIGRGGQCTYATCLFLYRALGGFRFSTRPTKSGQETFLWSDLTDKYPSARSARPGDVVFKKGSPNHIGICVVNFGNGKLDVVDSNYCGYGKSGYSVGSYQGVYNSEIIGRHVVDVDAEHYRLFSGDRSKNALGWY